MPLKVDKHKHMPEKYRKLTHSGMKTQCAICGHFIIYIEPKNREPHWRRG